MTATISASFKFLGAQDAQLVRLESLAERYFKDDPNIGLIKPIFSMVSSQERLRYQRADELLEFLAHQQRNARSWVNRRD